MPLSDRSVGIVASAIATLGGLLGRGGRPFFEVRDMLTGSIMTDSSVIAVNWHETRKCPVGAFTLLPDRGSCDVLAAVTERVTVWRLRELQPWRDLTGSPLCTTLLHS